MARRGGGGEGGREVRHFPMIIKWTWGFFASQKFAMLSWKYTKQIHCIYSLLRSLFQASFIIYLESFKNYCKLKCEILYNCGTRSKKWNPYKNSFWYFVKLISHFRLDISTNSFFIWQQILSRFTHIGTGSQVTVSIHVDI